MPGVRILLLRLLLDVLNHPQTTFVGDKPVNEETAKHELEA